MKKNIRKIIFFSYLIAFIVICPMAIIYTFGYSFNFDKMTLEKTGNLIIETKPSGAEVYINSKPQFINYLDKFFNKKKIVRTPARSRRLLPKNYEVELKKDGYHNFIKDCFVKPSETTYVNYTFLIKDNLPNLLMSFNQDKPYNFVISPDKKLAALDFDKNISLVSLEGEEKIIKTIDTGSKSERRQILWSFDSKKILVNNYIYDLQDDKQNISLIGVFDKTCHNFKWSNFNSAIYCQDSSGIKSYDVDEKSYRSVLNIKDDENILDFALRDNYLFLIKKDKKGIFFQVLESNSLKEVSSINFNRGNSFNFIESNGYPFGIYTNENDLYLINKSPFLERYSLELSLRNVKKPFISNGGVIYEKNNELWFYNQQKNKHLLLLHKINNANNFIFNRNWLFYKNAKNEISASSFQDFDNKNFINLIKFNETYFLNQNIDGNSLYFIAKTGEVYNFYRLDIF